MANNFKLEWLDRSARILRSDGTQATGLYACYAAFHEDVLKLIKEIVAARTDDMREQIAEVQSLNNIAHEQFRKDFLEWSDERTRHNQPVTFILPATIR